MSRTTKRSGKVVVAVLMAACLAAGGIVTWMPDAAVGMHTSDGAGPITSGNIADVTVSTNISLEGFRTTSGAALGVAGGAVPYFTAATDFLYIVWDASQTGPLLGRFEIPDDYIGGATISCQMSQDAATVANIESWNLDVVLVTEGGGGFSYTAPSGGAVDLANSVAIQTISFDIVNEHGFGGIAVGDSLMLRFNQANGSSDDKTQCHSCSFIYGAKQ